MKRRQALQSLAGISVAGALPLRALAQQQPAPKPPPSMSHSKVEPASVAVLIGTFASVVTLTSVMWFIQSGRLAFP